MPLEPGTRVQVDYNGRQVPATVVRQMRYDLVKVRIEGALEDIAIPLSNIKETK